VDQSASQRPELPSHLDPLVPAVPVELDRLRWLVEDFDAMIGFDAQTGLNSRDPDQMRLLTAHQTVWHFVWLLRRDDPDVTFEQVSRWLSAPVTSLRLHTAKTRLIARFVDELREAIGEQMPDGEKDADPLAGGLGGGSTPIAEPVSDSTDTSSVG